MRRKDPLKGFNHFFLDPRMTHRGNFSIPPYYEKVRFTNGLGACVKDVTASWLIKEGYKKISKEEALAYLQSIRLKKHVGNGLDKKKLQELRQIAAELGIPAKQKPKDFLIQKIQEEYDKRLRWQTLGDEYE